MQRTFKPITLLNSWILTDYLWLLHVELSENNRTSRGRNVCSRENFGGDALRTGIRISCSRIRCDAVPRRSPGPDARPLSWANRAQYRQYFRLHHGPIGSDGCGCLVQRGLCG